MKVARIVTAEQTIFFLLANTLNQFDGSYELTVIGPVTAEMKSRWPKVKWIEVHFGRKIHLLKDFVNFFRLIWILRRHKFDIVHSLMPKTSLMSALAAWIARTPIRMHTFTGQVWANKQGLPKLILRFCDNIVCFLNTRCFADSATQVQFLKSQGVPWTGQIELLGQGSLAGFDFSRLQNCKSSFRNEFRQKYGLAPEDFLFIFLGRKNKEKGVYEILQALRNNSDLHFVFVGPDEDGFSEFLKNSGHAHVIDIGPVENPLDYFVAADCLVLPSHREGFGNVVIEAAAMGLPCIGTKIPGLIDAVVDSETGKLVPPKDVAALAQAMHEFSSRPQISRQLGKNAQARAREFFSSERLYQELLQVYLEEFKRLPKALS